MDSASLTQLGLGGVVTLLILKEVFTFISNKNHQKNGCQNGSTTHSLLQDTHDIVVQNTLDSSVRMTELIQINKEILAEIKNLRNVLVEEKPRIR